MGLIRRKYGKRYFEALEYMERPDCQRNRNRLREILAYKQGGKLLEIGCGMGGFLQVAAKHFDVEGIDISSYAITSSRRTLGDKVRQGDIEKVDLMPGRYDVVAIFNVLEHLKRPGRVIVKMYRSLRSQGIVIGSVPFNFGPVGGIHTAITNLLDKTHCSTYGPRRWRALFREAGFRESRYFGEIMIGRNHCLYARHVLWRLIALNLMFVCKKQLY